MNELGLDAVKLLAENNEFSEEEKRKIIFAYLKANENRTVDEINNFIDRLSQEYFESIAFVKLINLVFTENYSITEDNEGYLIHRVMND